MFNVYDIELPEFPTDIEAEHLVAEAQLEEENRFNYSKQALIATIITPYLFDLVQFSSYGDPYSWAYTTEHGEKGEINKAVFEDTILFWKGDTFISSADIIQSLRNEAHAIQSPLTLSFFKRQLAELQRYGAHKIGEQFYIKNKFKLFEYLIYLCKAYGIEYVI